MEKEKYERIELDIILFLNEDVICTSGTDNYEPEDDELPLSPNQ